MNIHVDEDCANMQCMKLYIIRHGETFGNLNGDGFSETDQIREVPEAPVSKIFDRKMVKKIERIG